MIPQIIIEVRGGTVDEGAVILFDKKGDEVEAKVRLIDWDNLLAKGLSCPWCGKSGDVEVEKYLTNWFWCSGCEGNFEFVDGKLTGKMLARKRSFA